MAHWFKFYGLEYLSDPKMVGLSASEKACWVTLLCLASNTEDGLISFVDEERIKTMTGIMPSDDNWDLPIFEKFQKLALIEVHDDGVLVVNFSKRQDSNLTDAERAAKYRIKRKLRDERHTDNVTNVTPEQNRTEQNRTEKRESKPSPKPKFKKPTVEEVRAYCTERKNGIDAQRFVDFYESKGWKVGSNPMKDWKACVRTWEQRDGDKKQFSTGGSSTKFKDVGKEV